DAPGCQTAGISHLRAKRSCHVIVPGWVAADVSHTGIWLAGCKTPIGLPTPSPKSNALLIVAAMPSLIFCMIQVSAFPAASSRKSRVAHATNRMLSGLISSCPKPSTKSAFGLLAKQPASHAQAPSPIFGLSMRKTADGPEMLIRLNRLATLL